MWTPKVKYILIGFFLVSASAFADETPDAKQNSNQNGDAKATHIRAKVLDGGNEVDGGNARTPSTTEGQPYTDEEVKSPNPISNTNKNMPIDQD